MPIQNYPLYKMATFAYDIDAALTTLLRKNHLAGDTPFDAREAAAFLNLSVPIPCKQGAGCTLDKCCGFIHPGEEGVELKYLPEREFLDIQTGRVSNDSAMIRMVTASGKKADFYLRTRIMVSWEDWCFIKKIPYIPATGWARPSVLKEEELVEAQWGAFRDTERIEVLGMLADRPEPSAGGPLKPKLYNKIHEIVEQIKGALIESGWRILNRANRIPKNLTSILTQEFMELTSEDLYNLVTDDSLLTRRVLDGIEAYWLKPTAYSFHTQ